MIGAKLGNYRILEKIGAGGQGTVYRATDSKLGRTVVIKVLPPELTLKEANLKRFEREARLASALDHPNICTIFDLNEVGGVHFIAMQFVEGKNVRDLVNGRPLDLRSALSITIQVAEALAAAHERGILDRALAKDPKNRYQKAAALRHDLRTVLREIETGTLQSFTEPMTPVAPRHLSGTGRVGRAMRWLRGVTGERTSQQRASTSDRPAHETPATSIGDSERKSVAILPFKNVGNDSSSSFYEFSLADAVITELA